MIAQEDLEIRGGGEMLGERQSGHVDNIGLSLYLSMLKEKSLSKFLIFSNPSLFILPILKQLTPNLEKSVFRSDSDCIISPAFSEKNNLTVSLHPISVRSMSIPILSEEKHNSSKVVIIPPDDIS